MKEKFAHLLHISAPRADMREANFSLDGGLAGGGGVLLTPCAIEKKHAVETMYVQIR